MLFVAVAVQYASIRIHAMYILIFKGVGKCQIKQFRIT